MADSGEISFKLRINWRTGVEVALVWAAEDSLLSLIGDATVNVRLATIGCAVFALIALQIPGWRQRYFKIAVLAVAAAIYSGFLYSAVVQALERQKLDAGLRGIYTSGNALIARKVPAKDDNQNLFDDAALAQWRVDSGAWERTSAEWIADNMGSAAQVRFLDMGSLPNLCWRPDAANADFACDGRTQFLNKVLAEQRNISTLLEHMPVYSP